MLDQPELSDQLVPEADHHARTNRAQIRHELVIRRCGVDGNCDCAAHDRHEGHDHLGAIGKEESYAVVRSYVVLVQLAEPGSHKMVELCVRHCRRGGGDVDCGAISPRKRVQQRTDFHGCKCTRTSKAAALLSLEYELLLRRGQWHVGGRAVRRS